VDSGSRLIVGLSSSPTRVLAFAKLESGFCSVISVDPTTGEMYEPRFQTLHIGARVFLSLFPWLWVLDIRTYLSVNATCSTNAPIGDTFALSFSARIARTFSTPSSGFVFHPTLRLFCFCIRTIVRMRNRRFETRQIRCGSCRQKRYLVRHRGSHFADNSRFVTDDKILSLDQVELKVKSFRPEIQQSLTDASSLMRRIDNYIGLQDSGKNWQGENI
jgi:hypothetical protein